jgi:predicted MFS family arabinose efflux permease
MLKVLAYPIYRNLFLAQVIALLGTGLATVALALLAYELAQENAGLILGTVLTIKMLAYVFVAPFASALLRSLPRRQVLVSLDLIRAGVALLLPFVTEVWQVYLLIFFLQSTSACFTPLFQATIPDILNDEDDYTNALSLSRLAYDMENLISPTLAALLLSFMSWHGLFSGTVLGFIASAVLVTSVSLPIIRTSPRTEKSFIQKTTRGIRFYLATPRLRGLLALNFSVTAAGAMVFVNTVVIMQAKFGLTAQDTAMALAFFGGGSMLAALLMPAMLRVVKDRTLMLMASLMLSGGLVVASNINSPYMLMVIWSFLGFGYAMVQTPSGRLLTRSSHSEDRPDLFAAQFSLSHGCWLIFYPLAGWLGVMWGLPLTFMTFAAVTLLALFVAVVVWPADDQNEIEHSHDDLPQNHPHLNNGHKRHKHIYVIDELHTRWPE